MADRSPDCDKYTVQGVQPGTLQACPGTEDVHGLCSNADAHIDRYVAWEHGERDHVADRVWNANAKEWQTDEEFEAYLERRAQYRAVMGNAEDVAQQNHYEHNVLGL